VEKCEKTEAAAGTTSHYALASIENDNGSWTLYSLRSEI
jgi:hypothetical protein